MKPDVIEAVGLIILAAAMNATYTLPMKLNRRWAWEHSWFAFSLLGVAAVPTVFALLTVPGLWSIYGQTPTSTLLAMAMFGVAWGVSLVLFGLAISMVGIAITFAVALGASAASGALIPLITQHPERILSTQGMLVLLGIAIILLGVGLCGLAGNRRDRAARARSDRDAQRFFRGFLYALVSGVLGSMLNLGLAFGGAIQQRAREQGASVGMMSNAVWLPCLYAGFIPGVIYCLRIMKKNSNLEDLGAKSRWFYWLMAICMGVLWFGSIMCYSLSTVKLGDLGAIIGWPLFLSAVVIGSTITGLLAGEWTSARKGALQMMGAGVACLVLAMIVLARASG